MNELLFLFMKNYENSLRAFLMKTLKDIQDIPEMMHGMMILQAANSYCKNVKEDYPNLINDFKENNILLTESDYYKILETITSNVVNEFVDFSSKSAENSEYDININDD